MRLIALRNAHLHAEVLPAAAGGLARLDWIGDGPALPAQPVLRACTWAPGAPPPTTSQLACFPLVPWSNRIGGGGFTFEGRHVPLAPNRPGEACPIHGDGWQHPWDVVAQSAAGVTLSLDRRGGDPFSYRARLDYFLVDRALRVSLAVTNTGAAALPFGLGLHPWFARTDGVLLHARARTVWTRGADGLPDAETAVPAHWDFSAPRTLPRDHVDNVHTGWDGRAAIAWPGTGLALDIDADMAHYILYAPAGKDVFCFEPVDHAINAHNLPGGAVRHGLTVLAPGQTLRRHVGFTVSRQAAGATAPA